MDVFARIREGLAAEVASPKTVIIDAIHLKVHRTPSRLTVKRGAGTADRAHKRRDEPEAACRHRRRWRPIRFFMTAGQVSDYTGAAALVDDLPAADWLLADRSYDADWFREALQSKGSDPDRSPAARP